MLPSKWRRMIKDQSLTSSRYSLCRCALALPHEWSWRRQRTQNSSRESSTVLSLSVFSKASLCLNFSVVFCIWTGRRCWSGPRYRHCPRNLAALKLLPHRTASQNLISPWQDFEEIRYIVLSPDPTLSKGKGSGEYMTTYSGVKWKCVVDSSWHIISTSKL